MDSTSLETDRGKVYKLVLTGGPCGGKTTGQARITSFFESLGWKVYRVPETATVLMGGGIKFADLTKAQAYRFQENLIRTMMQIERSLFDVAPTPLVTTPRPLTSDVGRSVVVNGDCEVVIDSAGPTTTTTTALDDGQGQGHYHQRRVTISESREIKTDNLRLEERPRVCSDASDIAESRSTTNLGTSESQDAAAVDERKVKSANCSFRKRSVRRSSASTAPRSVMYICDRGVMDATASFKLQANLVRVMQNIERSYEELCPRKHGCVCPIGANCAREGCLDGIGDSDVEGSVAVKVVDRIGFNDGIVIFGNQTKLTSRLEEVNGFAVRLINEALESAALHIFPTVPELNNNDVSKAMTSRPPRNPSYSELPPTRSRRDTSADDIVRPTLIICDRGIMDATACMLSSPLESDRAYD